MNPGIPPASAQPEPAGGAAAALDPDGRLRAVVSDCVHCGFCLPSCPTYQLWGEEMDSPRGRIYLIGQMLDGARASETAAVHVDRCLGCMACVPACPSGVRFDRLIEAARSWREEPPAGAAPMPARPARERAVRAAIFASFPYPRRLAALRGPLRLAQRTGSDRLLGRSRLAARLFPELAAALRLAPGGGRRRAGTSPSGRIPARGQRRAVVGMLTGCVQQAFFPDVNAATARVLAAEGCEVVVPAGPACCGALSLHGGRRQQARRLARQQIEAFSRAAGTDSDGLGGLDAIVVNAAGCGSAMKEYGELLADDDAWAGQAAAFSARVRDLSEFLADLGPVAPRHPLPVTVAYHDPCHLGHAQRITAAPRELLAGIPGLRLAGIADAGTCCGSAGIYNLVQPAAAAELGRRKAAAVADTGAQLLVSANPGCALQIGTALAAQGHQMPVAHIAEVLDAAIRGIPLVAPGDRADDGRTAPT